MADSNITKRALAAALQELMTELPFEKINVSLICERCQMSRKSFYYHFKDKYDLVNWIFDTEFIPLVQTAHPDDTYEEHWSFMQRSCEYFYQHHDFYRKALQIRGQNSFLDHFREYIRPLVTNRLLYLLGSDQIDEFSMNFFADGVICAIERWLLTKDCMTSQEFVGKIRSIMERSASSICREMAHAKQNQP